MQYLDTISKTIEWSLVCFQGKPFNITVIQVYAPANNGEEAETERFYEDIQDLLELTPKKDYRGLECKSRKSGDTWSKRQIWPWSREWSRAKVNRVLPREHTGHSKHPFQQHKRRRDKLSIWASPDGQYHDQIDYIFAAKDGEALYSQHKEHWDLTVAQMINSLF